MARKRKLPEGMWKRGKSYYACFRAGGRLIRKSLSTDFEAAKEILNDLKARADKADFNLIDNDFSLADLRDQWLRHCDQTLRPSTVKRYRENLANLFAKLPCTKVSQVTAAVVLTYRDDRRKELASARTVNMEVGALSTMFNWGVEHHLIGSNPLATIRPLPTDKKEKERRALTAGEVQAIFDASPPHLRPVWRMFLSTGIRKEELVGMKFSDIDFERRCVTVHASRAKNHRTREIPLDDELLAMLADLRDKAKDRQPVDGPTPRMTEQQHRNFSREHVFVTSVNTPFKNNLLRTFYSVCKAAGIDDAHAWGAVDIHATRGTFTTLAIDGGASPKAVQAILGHSTLDMTMKVYAKATEKAKRDAIGALPFAKVTSPPHVISMQNAHRMRTVDSDEPKTETA